MQFLIKSLWHFIWTIFFIFLLLNYIKWEYLSKKYSSFFEESILKGINQTDCLISEPQVIKVLEYEPPNAKLFIQDVAGGNYLLYLTQRSDGSWSFFEGKGCDDEMINTTLAGSAHGCFLWYFWLC